VVVIIVLIVVVVIIQFVVFVLELFFLVLVVVEWIAIAPHLGIASGREFVRIVTLDVLPHHRGLLRYLFTAASTRGTTKNRVGKLSTPGTSVNGNRPDFKRCF